CGDQPQVPDEWIEVAIAVKQRVMIGDAACRDQRIDGLAHRNAAATQVAMVACRLQRDLEPTVVDYLKPAEEAPGKIEVSFRCETLQHFRQDEIADADDLGAEEPVEPVGFGCDPAAKKVDPDAGVDEDHRLPAMPSYRHLSVRIDSRSP